MTVIKILWRSLEEDTEFEIDDFWFDYIVHENERCGWNQFRIHKEFLKRVHVGKLPPKVIPKSEKYDGVLYDFIEVDEFLKIEGIINVK